MSHTKGTLRFAENKFDEWASQFDYESREWLDMGNDKVFKAGWQARQPEIDALKVEVEQLREAAEKVLRCFDSSARYSTGFESACEALRDALEKK